MSKAMSKSFIASGGEIKSDAEVKEILIRNNRSYGVVLKNGDEIYAKRIVSNMDVKRTFLKTVKEKD